MMLPPTALPELLRVAEPEPPSVDRDRARAELPGSRRRTSLFGVLPGLRSTATEGCRPEVVSDLESKA